MADGRMDHQMPAQRPLLRVWLPGLRTDPICVPTAHGFYTHPPHRARQAAPWALWGHSQAQREHRA